MFDAELDAFKTSIDLRADAASLLAENAGQRLGGHKGD
jgi:hypothetical protein